MTTNSELLNSFWVVSEKDGRLLINTAHYGKLNEFVWFIKIESGRGSFISFFPYISTFHLSLEIRSNNAFPVTEEVEETATDYFPGAEPLGTFESGPIIGFFPYYEEKEVIRCIKSVSEGIDSVPLKDRALWAIHTNRMIKWIRTTMPLVRMLPTPREVLGI